MGMFGGCGRKAVCSLVIGLASISAWAHGPTRQKVVEAVEIDAPAEKVWALVGDFAGWQKWHPAIEASSADKGNESGSLRHLTIKGGKFLDESLEGYDESKMTLRYRIKAGNALPVTNYSSTMTVTRVDAKTRVEWRGAFYRGFPNNDPPPDQNDEAAVAAVTGVYQAGLSNLKTIVEQK